MTNRLLIGTDLDRTLIPNGEQSESPGARSLFTMLAARPEVTLAYISGRHRNLIMKAIENYNLPIPDYVIADVGTSMFQLENVSNWNTIDSWQEHIAKDWSGKSTETLKRLLSDIPELRAQEYVKQGKYKLSYYVSLVYDHNAVARMIHERLAEHDIVVRQIWSIDEPQGVGLLDILPQSASKYHALKALMQIDNFTATNTVFSGDSGNDIEVLSSEIPGVLVANSQIQVQQTAMEKSNINGHSDKLYIARGGLLGMNGNYSAGIVEGVMHYHPDIKPWLSDEYT